MQCVAGGDRFPGQLAQEQLRGAGALMVGLLVDGGQPEGLTKGMGVDADG